MDTVSPDESESTEGGAGADLVRGAVVPLRLTDRVAAGGDVIGHLPDGRVVMVEGALPGESVNAQLVQVKKDFAKARTAEVVDASEDRVAPTCPHRKAGCGGCGWMEVARPAQLRFKQEILADSLKRLAGIEAPPISATVHVPHPQRTNIRVHIDPGGRPGFRRRASDSAVEVDSCPAADPAISDLLAGLRLPRTREATIRVSRGSGETMLVLDRKPKGRAQLPEGAVVAMEDGKLLRAEYSGRRRKAAITETVGGTELRVSAASFFQSSPEVALAITDTVDALIGKQLDLLVGQGRLLDAYAGVGVIGLLLAERHGVEVVAVESLPAAASDLRYNAARLRKAGRALSETVESEFGAFRGGKFPVAVADPARPGLGRPGVDSVVAARVETLALVSCDPASLARDCRWLAEEGYRLESVTPIEAYVDTPHVEAVSLFRKL